jgi:hypothetical protein
VRPWGSEEVLRHKAIERECKQHSLIKETPGILLKSQLFRRLRQKDYEFKTSLDNIGRPPPTSREREPGTSGSHL